MAVEDVHALDVHAGLFQFLRYLCQSAGLVPQAEDEDLVAVFMAVLLW